MQKLYRRQTQRERKEIMRKKESEDTWDQEMVGDRGGILHKDRYRLGFASMASGERAPPASAPYPSPLPPPDDRRGAMDSTRGFSMACQGPRV